MKDYNDLNNLNEIILNDDIMSYAFESSHSLSETYYKINILSDKILEKEEDNFSTKYISYELLPVIKSARLIKIIDFYIYENESKLTNFELAKYRKNVKILTLLLSSISEGSYTFEYIKGVVYLKSNSVYGYTKKYDYGRLYPKYVSINQLSREFRYYLFGNIYNDIDIVNAHPTILYNFAQEQNLHTPTLQLLVEDRDYFYEQIIKDYSYDIDPKKLVLISINMNKVNFTSLKLNSLVYDLRKIRESLYNLYENDENYRSAIDFRCDNNTTTDMKISKIQSLFCFNKETEHIMSFINFYKNKIPFELKEVNSFVPFFDGLYIFSNSLVRLNTSNMHIEKIKVDLDNIMKEYNETNKIKFVKKNIQPIYKLISLEDFNRIESAICGIENMSYDEIKKEIGELNISHEIISCIQTVLKESECKVDFTYEQLNTVQCVYKKMYNKLIKHKINKNTIS